MNLGENRYQKRDVKEFQVPVPWGHVAVKAWGNENDPFVLVFHGIKDNAGSFDNLIPVLPNTFYYICVDLPGHGKSSHFPPLLPIHSTDYLITYKFLVDYFKKDKYIFMGHCYGAQIAFLFSRIYPNFVRKLITLEALPLFTIEIKETINYLRKNLEVAVSIQEKLATGEAPLYTYEEALKKLYSNRYFGGPLLRHAAEPLLKRSLVNAGNGKYSFTTDQRLKAYFNPLHDMRYSIENLKYDPVTCPVFMIFAKLNDRPQKKFARVLEHLKTNKNVTVMYVDGDHDVHNNYPERVANYVTKFLLLQEAKM